MKEFYLDISLTQAIIYCLIISIIYVYSLYLIPVSIRLLHRDNIKKVKYRILASSIASFIVFCFMYNYLLHNLKIINKMNVNDLSNIYVNVLEFLGFTTNNIITSSIITILLMSIFYLGPIIVHLIMSYLLINFNINSNGEIINYNYNNVNINSDHMYNNSTLDVIKKLCNFQKNYILELYIEFKTQFHIPFRNLIFAPISEEIVFRSMMLPFLISGINNYSNEDNINNYDNNENIQAIYACMLCPIFFAVAHVHHIFEKVYQGFSLSTAILSTILQMTYTSIFGFIAAMFLIKTGNIIAPIIAHIYCNYMGLPNIGFMTPPGKVNMSSSQLSYLYPHRNLLIILHIGGLILFYFLFFPITSFIER